MSFQPVILWSDVLLWGLVALTVGSTVIARRDPLLSAAWRRVGQRASGAGSAVVLLFFVVVGLADSLHFRMRLAEVPGGGHKSAYSVEVHSLLDLALGPLRTRIEKTYSEPLATRSFAKEMLTTVDGSQVREFPLLRHGGRHLVNESDRMTDVLGRVMVGATAGFLLLLLLLGAVTRHEAHLQKKSFNAALRAVWRGKTTIHWRAVLGVLALLLVSGGGVAALADGYHVLGTDKVGQDVLYHILKSVRTALVIGLLTTLVTLPIGIALGVAAGYFRGWIDDLIQYLYTTLNSIPGVLLIAAAALMMKVVIDIHPEWFPTTAERADAQLLALCLILGMTSWTGIARLLRAETLKLSQLEYVQAARSFGVAQGTILRRHILPNVMHIVIIALVMDFSGLVLAEAVLSYVGIGVDPSMISFGTMINNARMELSREPVVWWSLTGAFVAMFVLVLAANLLADVVRDAFDPRQAENSR